MYISLTTPSAAGWFVPMPYYVLLFASIHCAKIFASWPASCYAMPCWCAACSCTCILRRRPSPSPPLIPLSSFKKHFQRSSSVLLLLFSNGFVLKFQQTSRLDTYIILYTTIIIQNQCTLNAKYSHNNLKESQNKRIYCEIFYWK